QGPAIAAPHDVDAAPGVAPLQFRQQELGIGLLAEIGRDLGGGQWLARREQQRFGDAQLALCDLEGFVPALGCHQVGSSPPRSCCRRRMNSGPKVRFWRSSIWPCRTSSRLEAKLEAIAVAFCPGSSRYCARYWSSGTQSALSPISRCRISRASCSDHTVRSCNW